MQWNSTSSLRLKWNNMISDTIKTNFPFFSEGGKDIAYLDNAASSQTPEVVLEAMDAYYTKFRANVHRGLYEASEAASVAYEEARVKVARFIGADPREVIFTAGATASSNMLMLMLERSGQFAEGDEIVTTVSEHHGSIIPLQELAHRNPLQIKHIPVQGRTLDLDYEIAEKLITKKTKIVSVMLASNVTGAIYDVARIAKMAHTVGALVICDATAAVGHMPVDVKNLGADFVYFSGHKMCGPTGIGVLWGRGAVLENLAPGFYGGGNIEEVTLEQATFVGVPERFEAGTPNIAGAIGLGAAADYLEHIGVENIRAHTESLTKEAIARLKEIPGVRLIAEEDVSKNIGIVSFFVDGVHPHDIADILGREGVAVRAGHHCAMPLHTFLGVSATVRVSFYFYNTRADIDALVAGIKKAKEVFKI